MENLDSFERMATGLSNDERQNILERLKSTSQAMEAAMISPVEEETEEEYIPFPQQIKKETFLIRFLIWIKSVVTNTNPESLYNEYKISNIGKNVEKNFPGLIDSKKGMILSTFYNKLTELKSAASFLKPYLSAVEEDEGAFYVLLGSLVMPEVNASMNSEADPYSNEVTSSVRPELRLSLIHKMDDIFDRINQAEKSAMYESVKAAEWLRQFVKLPFTKFLSSFSTLTEDINSLSFGQAQSEISAFAKSLCNSFIISDELLEALYLFSIKHNKTTAAANTEAEASQFLDKAHASIALLHMFMTSVPLRSIGCLIFNDSHWRVEPFSGGEDWFVRYKNSWKKIFEQKWKAWTKDCQKESLKINLKNNLGLNDFPYLPHRPWAEIWGGEYFRYELTAGFLYWFIVKKFPDYEIALKTVLVEGNFIKRDNQLAFTDAFNNIIQLSITFQSLLRRCAPSGETGMIFSKLREEHLRTLKAQTKVEQMIRSIESDFESILHKFGESSRSLTQLLNGILGVVKDSRFDSISNLNRLQGKDNDKFQEKLSQARTGLETSLNLIQDLETLDAQKTKF